MFCAALRSSGGTTERWWFVSDGFKSQSRSRALILGLWRAPTLPTQGSLLQMVGISLSHTFAYLPFKSGADKSVESDNWNPKNRKKEMRGQLQRIRNPIFQGFPERKSSLLQNNQAPREMMAKKAALNATMRAPPSLLVDPSSSTSSIFGAKSSSQTIPRGISWLSSVSPWNYIFDRLSFFQGVIRDLEVN